METGAPQTVRDLVDRFTTHRDAYLSSEYNETQVHAKTATEKTLFERQVASANKDIDQLVYELYNLTDEEIRIVEEATETD